MPLLTGRQHMHTSTWFKRQTGLYVVVLKSRPACSAAHPETQQIPGSVACLLCCSLLISLRCFYIMLKDVSRISFCFFFFHSLLSKCQHGKSHAACSSLGIKLHIEEKGMLPLAACSSSETLRNVKTHSSRLLLVLHRQGLSFFLSYPALLYCYCRSDIHLSAEAAPPHPASLVGWQHPDRSGRVVSGKSWLVDRWLIQNCCDWSSAATNWSRSSGLWVTDLMMYFNTVADSLVAIWRLNVRSSL